MFYYLNIVQLTITHFTMNLIKKKKIGLKYVRYFNVKNDIGL